jgi:hypothetical protein
MGTLWWWEAALSCGLLSGGRAAAFGDCFNQDLHCCHPGLLSAPTPHSSPCHSSSITAALHGKHSCLCTGERSSFGKRPCASLCLWWCSTPADILPVHCKADANGACGGLKNPVCKSCSSTLQAVICRDIFIACFSVVYLMVFVQFVVSAPICQFCDWTWLV